MTNIKCHLTYRCREPSNEKVEEEYGEKNPAHKQTNKQTDENCEAGDISNKRRRRRRTANANTVKLNAGG